MSLLRLENVSRSFGKTKALSDINLTIEEGTFCVILGPSGCGKSTLLNLIAGLEELSKGKIYFKGNDITQWAPQKRNMAFVFQSYALYPHLSVFENIAFGLRIRGVKSQDIKAKVKEVSRILNIADKLDKLPGELSGGEKQRVATGRAIVRDPSLFLFDEPLSNLDARLRVELRSEFIRLHQRLKKTIIYVTHDQIEGLVLGQVVVVLKDGKIQQVSTPHELYYNPGNLFVAEFIGTPPMNIIRFKVRKIEDCVKLVREEFILDVSKRHLEKFIDKDVYFGFRPNAAHSGPQGKIRGEVIFVETIGEDKYAHVRVGSGVEVKIRVIESLVPKDTVIFSLDEEKCFLFDIEGTRIYF